MSERGDADDDVTIWAGRLRPWPSAPVGDEPEAEQEAAPEVDDETVVARRRRDHGPDETTAPSRRRPPRPAAAELADAPALEPVVTPAAVSAEAPIAAPDDVPDNDTAPGSRERARASDVPETRVRRSALRAAEGLPAERRPRVPAPDDHETYRPRAVAPEVVVRAAPAPHTPQAAVDVAAASAARSRRVRRRALVVAGVVALALVAAVITVVWAIVAPT